jgi:hypothetical protein
VSRLGALKPWALAGLGAALAWAALAHWVPPDGVEYSICAFRRLTHVPCPGCGLTRAFAHLAKGHLGEGLRMHPLAPLLAVEGAVLWLAWGLAVGRGRPWLPGRWPVRLAAGHAAALLVLWVGRLATGTLPP